MNYDNGLRKNLNTRIKYMMKVDNQDQEKRTG